MLLFYAPDLKGATHHLSEEESRHCSKDLRLKPGDEIFLTDGKGNLFRSVLADVNVRGCHVEIAELIEDYGRKNYKLHIGIAPTKNIERFEWFLEKATEIGIDEITPVICEHSERREIRIDRLNKVIASAMKQSLKTWHPLLNPPVSFDALIKKEITGKKFIAHLQENDPLHLKHNYKAGNDVIILIGPEGDFSGREVESAVKQGFEIISLGKSRLRTETAGVAACGIIAMIND